MISFRHIMMQRASSKVTTLIYNSRLEPFYQVISGTRYGIICVVSVSQCLQSTREEDENCTLFFQRRNETQRKKKQKLWQKQRHDRYGHAPEASNNNHYYRDGLISVRGGSDLSSTQRIIKSQIINIHRRSFHQIIADHGINTTSSYLSASNPPGLQFITVQ